MILLSDFQMMTEVLSKEYKATVVDNQDPRRLGRVKVSIEGVMEDANPANLPWVFQRTPGMMGGRTDLGEFQVPEVGSQLIVVFPNDDVYAGFYIGYWQSEFTHQAFFDDDYPASYGWRDTQNTFFKVNRTKKEAEFRHTSGARTIVDREGVVEVESPKAIRFVSSDRKTEFFFDMETGQLKLTPKAELELGGAKTKYTAKEVEHQVGNVTENVSGGKATQVLGGLKTTVGSDDSKSVLGNKATSVGGDVSEVVAGEVSRTIGQGEETTVVLGDKKITLMLGNYQLEVTAGNISLKTNAGTVDLGNLLGKLSVDVSGNVAVESPGVSVDLTATNLETDAVAKQSFKAPLTAIGNGTVELLKEIADLATALGQLTALSPMGPCAPLQSAPQWAAVQTHLAKIQSITGTF